MGYKVDEDNYLAVKLSSDFNQSVTHYDGSKSGKTDDSQRGEFQNKEKSVCAVNVKALSFTRRESNVGVGRDIDNNNMTVNSNQCKEVFDETDYRRDITVGDVISAMHSSNVDSLQTSKNMVGRMGVSERPSCPTGERAVNSNIFTNNDTTVATDKDSNRVPALDVSNNKAVCKRSSVVTAADSGSDAMVSSLVDRAVGRKTVGESKQQSNSLVQSTAAVMTALESGQHQAVSVLRNQTVEVCVLLRCC
jgi:hypothetical protein